MQSKQRGRTTPPVERRARPRAFFGNERAEQHPEDAVAVLGGPGSVRSTDVLALQRAAGNQAVQRLLGPGGPASAVIQRVVAKLIDGLDVDDPSSYDGGGGHSYQDHGAHTTEEQQRTRLRSGRAPSGRNSPVPSGAGASKFASDAKHVEGMQAAAAELETKNEGKTKLRGITGPMPLAGAGPIYYRDGSTVSGETVYVDLAKVAGSTDTFHLNTMFPMP